MKDDKLLRLSRLCIVAAGGGVLLYIALKYLLPATLPILFACLLSSLTRPIVKYAAEKSRMPEKLCGVVITALFLFFASYALVNLTGKLTREIISAARQISSSLEDDDNIIYRVMTALSSLREHLPRYSLSTHRADELYVLLVDWIKSGIGTASEKLTARVASLISALPRLALSSAVSVIALFYLTGDGKRAKDAAARLLPRSVRERLSPVVEKLGGAVSGYIKSYSVLMLLTFGELFLGFVILRVRYAFLWAIVIALLDALPLLGVGTVLIPWACVSLICQNIPRGVGLLVLFAVMYVVRQLTEPRIIGRFMGIHPILTLAGAFAFYSLFGFWGMLLSPLILFIALSLSDGE